MLASDASQVAAAGLIVSDVAWAALTALESSTIALDDCLPSSIADVRSGVALRCMDARSDVVPVVQVHSCTAGSGSPALAPLPGQLQQAPACDVSCA